MKIEFYREKDNGFAELIKILPNSFPPPIGALVNIQEDWREFRVEKVEIDYVMNYAVVWLD